MSLIEEALRRVQDPSSGASGGVKAPPKPSPAKQESPAAPHSWTAEKPAPVPPPAASPFPASSQQPWILLVVLAAVAGCAVALLAGGLVWMKTTPSATKAAAQNPVSETSQQQPVKIQRKAVSANPLNLSGVVAGEGAPYAVINGKIFSVGEQVEGAKIIAIDSRSVTLEYQNGQQTTLTVPR